MLLYSLIGRCRLLSQRVKICHHQHIKMMSDSSRVIELKFSNGFFRLKSDREFVLSYFTPFRSLLAELNKKSDNDDEDIKVSVHKGEQFIKLEQHSTLGDVLSQFNHCIIEYSDQSRIKLKLKGNQSQLTPWKSVELKFREDSPLIAESLIEEKEKILIEFGPMLNQYKSIIEEAKWKDSWYLMCHILFLGCVAHLIFIRLGWDIMEPLTFIVFNVMLHISQAYFFHPQAHYVSCPRKLRMMRHIRLICSKKNFDLERFKRMSDQIFQIEDRLNFGLSGSGKLRLVDHCGPLNT